MTSPIITEAVRALVDRRDLTRIEAAAAMEAIMTGAATGAQIGAFLTALRMKGETVEELIGFAQVMRQKVVRIRARGDDVAGISGTDREMLIDTCGTGGDATGTFNVSTATAFVVAGAGLRVAKHGNRSVSSLCGSADVVETLGISLGLPPASIKDLQGGDREQNAEIIRAVLGGETGPRRDIVLMNAAAALVAGARARDLKDGVAVAAQSIDSRAARGKLDALVALSRRLAEET